MRTKNEVSTFFRAPLQRLALLQGGQHWNWANKVTYTQAVLINKLGTWMVNPKLMSTEIYQNSLAAYTGSHLSWKAVWEEIDFFGSHTTFV